MNIEKTTLPRQNEKKDEIAAHEDRLAQIKLKHQQRLAQIKIQKSSKQKIEKTSVELFSPSKQLSLNKNSPVFTPMGGPTANVKTSSDYSQSFSFPKGSKKSQSKRGSILGSSNLDLSGVDSQYHPDRCKIYLSGIPKCATKGTIREIFESWVGHVLEINIISQTTLGPFRYGFVTFADQKCVETCLTREGIMIEGNFVTMKKFKRKRKKAQKKREKIKLDEDLYKSAGYDIQKSKRKYSYGPEFLSKSGGTQLPRNPQLDLTQIVGPDYNRRSRNPIFGNMPEVNHERPVFINSSRRSKDIENPNFEESNDKEDMVEGEDGPNQQIFKNNTLLDASMHSFSNLKLNNFAGSFLTRDSETSTNSQGQPKRPKIQIAGRLRETVGLKSIESKTKPLPKIGHFLKNIHEERKRKGTYEFSNFN